MNTKQEMSAQYTPGLWRPARDLGWTSNPRPWTAYRQVGPGTIESLRDRRGRVRGFATEAAVLAAIAKATGSAA